MSGIIINWLCLVALSIFSRIDRQLHRIYDACGMYILNTTSISLLFSVELYHMATGTFAYSDSLLFLST